MTLFKLSDIIQEKKESIPVDDRDQRLVQKFQQMHFQKLENLKNLCGSLPNEDEILFLETSKSFNAFTFVVYLVRHAGRIDDLFVATYSINSRIVNSLINWMDKGQIGKIHIYISDSIHHRTPKIVDLIDSLAQARPDQIKVTYSWTHKKVMCALIGSDHYVVEGSGNWGENSAEEQYLFTKSKKLYEFRRGEY